MKRLSLVIPLYNEEASLRSFYRKLRNVLDGLNCDSEIIFVNDGSTDQTEEILHDISRADREIRVIQLSRNFGHQAALSAGLEAAQGEMVISMDGDGQHPPEMIPEMIALCESGYDIVQTQRISENNPNPLKRWTSSGFYSLINHISATKTIPGGADFRLMNRKSLDSLIAMPEYHRFLRGMVTWIGFRSVILPFQPEKRIAGKSKYTIGKMLRLASDAIFSFSMAPLYIGLSAGLFFLILAFIEAIYVLSFWISGNTSNLAPGWSSLMFFILIIGAVLMIILGFIGVYVGYIFQEVKRRPVYIVRKETAGEDCSYSSDSDSGSSDS